MNSPPREGARAVGWPPPLLEVRGERAYARVHPHTNNDSSPRNLPLGRPRPRCASLTRALAPPGWLNAQDLRLRAALGAPVGAAAAGARASAPRAGARLARARAPSPPMGTGLPRAALASLGGLREALDSSLVSLSPPPCARGAGGARKPAAERLWKAGVVKRASGLSRFYRGKVRAAPRRPPLPPTHRYMRTRPLHPAGARAGAAGPLTRLFGSSPVGEISLVIAAACST